MFLIYIDYYKQIMQKSNTKTLFLVIFLKKARKIPTNLLCIYFTVALISIN